MTEKEWKQKFLCGGLQWTGLFAVMKALVVSFAANHGFTGFGHIFHHAVHMRHEGNAGRISS